MKFTIPFPNNNNATKSAYFSSSSSTRRVIAIIEGWSCDKCTYQHSYPAQICAMCNANCKDEDKDGNATGAYFYSSSARSATMTALKREWPLAASKKRPSRVAKKTVSYCDTSDSELEFDKDGYNERSKTKSFNKKANATNSSDSNKFELGPKADTSDSNKFELDPEADTMLLEIESEDEEMIGLKRKKNSNVQTQTHEYTGHPIDEFELGPEADTGLLEIESEAAIKSSLKSSVGVDERKFCSQAIHHWCGC
jgi:hypothetical protein